MKHTFIYIIALLLLAGCVYPYTADIDSSVNKEVVIDANILLGNKSVVNLYYLQSLEVGKTQTSTGYPSGTVYLQDEAGNTYPAEGSTGYFTLDVPESTGGKYRLTVVSEGNTYMSDWIEPVEPPVLKDIHFSADDEYVYVQMDMDDNGTGSGYAAVQFDEIWKFHTDYLRSYGYDVEKNSVFELMKPDNSHYWCWAKQVNESQQLVNYTELNGNVKNFVVQKFPRSDNRNHSEYDVKVKLWNLTPEQYRYRKMLEENASIGGNLFSPEPGVVKGNIYCENNPEVKVYGYVNIAKVTTYTNVLPATYSTWRVKYKLTEVASEDWPVYYGKGYMPVDLMLSDSGGEVVGWGEARCFDCIAAGGTLDKPDFD